MEFTALKPRLPADLIHGQQEQDSRTRQVATMTLFQQEPMVARIQLRCSSQLTMVFIPRKLKSPADLIHGQQEQDSRIQQVAITTLFQQAPMVARIQLRCS